MIRTAVLHNKQQSIKSLALSVHFKQPDFGMKDYEILSRATTFLLAVDPKDDSLLSGESKYSFLDKNQQEREARQRAQNYAYPPAGGPRRSVQDLGWLEYCPQKFRPIVHCVAASHVLAPWKWNNYYTQPWLQHVKPQHCVYTLEVFDPRKPQEALGKFALNPYPIHDPDGRDLALIHLKQEEEGMCVKGVMWSLYVSSVSVLRIVVIPLRTVALEQMKKLGVEILYRRDDETPFEKGDKITFDGFIVTEENTTDKDEFEAAQVCHDESLA